MPDYTPIHTTAEQVQAMLDAAPKRDYVASARVVLMPLDTTWNPASTKHPLEGPGVVRYVRYCDGVIDAFFPGSLLP